MECPYVVTDVFARSPLQGNALAVFHEPGTVPADRMQAVARETNLSETTFVTAIRPDGYDVRIFTPYTEMPFAGHPTLGTAWTLRHLGLVGTDHLTQVSQAGSTSVTAEGERMWLSRTGSVTPGDFEAVANAVGAPPDAVGFDAASIGGTGALMPAIANAGVEVVMLPLRSPEILRSLSVPGSLAGRDEVYCFAPLGPGRILARFFAPGLGIAEDPATGVAAAGLGLYLGAHIGEIAVTVDQGAQVGRPSEIFIEASPGSARVGGQVHLVAEGVLHL